MLHANSANMSFDKISDSFNFAIRNQYHFIYAVSPHFAS